MNGLQLVGAILVLTLAIVGAAAYLEGRER